MGILTYQRRTHRTPEPTARTGRHAGLAYALFEPAEPPLGGAVRDTTQSVGNAVGGDVGNTVSNAGKTVGDTVDGATQTTGKVLNGN